MDALVKLVFGSVICIGCALQLYYRRRYKVENRHSEETAFERFRFLMVRVGSLAIFAWLNNLSAVSFANILLPNLLRVLGMLTILIGLAIWIWSQISLGENWSGAVALREGHTITRQGPYARARHPMYGAFILLAVGMAISCNNWLASSLFCFHVFLTVSRAGSEEQLLESAFGDTYRDYRLSTGRYFPKIR